LVKLCGLSFYIKAYFSVQLMLICAVVNCKCAVVIGNLYSCNYSFLCSFPSVEQYLQKFSKQRNFAFGVQECLVMRFSSGFDSVFDYYNHVVPARRYGTRHSLKLQRGGLLWGQICKFGAPCGRCTNAKCPQERRKCTVSKKCHQLQRGFAQLQRGLIRPLAT